MSNTLDKATVERIESEAAEYARTYTGTKLIKRPYIAGATAEALKNKACVEALERLVKLKLHKDTMGKTVYYQKEQPLAWEAANVALNNLK